MLSLCFPLLPGKWTLWFFNNCFQQNIHMLQKLMSSHRVINELQLNLIELYDFRPIVFHQIYMYCRNLWVLIVLYFRKQLCVRPAVKGISAAAALNAATLPYASALEEFNKKKWRKFFCFFVNKNMCFSVRLDQSACTYIHFCRKD